MNTDFNSSLTDLKTHEAKLTTSSGRMAQFAYDSEAYQNDTAEGTATYNYGNHQNIPLGNAGTLNVDGQILDKGVRSQASSITRMMLNHFFGRASYNVNKMADYMKATFELLLAFMKEGSNAWSPTTTYVAGDLVYFVATVLGTATKRTFVCKESSTNKPPVDTTTGALINASYWAEVNFGNVTVNGDLNVNGNIYQNGSSYETHAEKIFTKKDMIYTREGAVAGLASNALTGLTGLLYDGTHNGVLGFDSTGTARVGDEGDTQPLLTRAETNALVNGHILVWDATNKRAVDGGKSIGDIVGGIIPIGTVYQNVTDPTNPATLLGVGTWERITDKFLVSRGSAFTSTGGATSYSLTYANIPQHQHAMQHTHTIEHTHYVSISGSTISQSNATTTTESAVHTHPFGVGIAFADGDNIGIPNGDGSMYRPQYTSPGGWVNTEATSTNASIPLSVKGGRSNIYRVMSLGDNTGGESETHTHQFEHGHNVSVSGNTNASSTPNSGDASREYTGYWGEPTVTAIDTIPPYQAVYTWYRTA